MTILVTGGAGYIGSHTVVALLENGFDILVVDNFSNSQPEALKRVRELAGREFVVHKIDQREREKVQRIFSDHQIDAVIHFAALKAVGESLAEPLKYYENNLGSLITLLTSMREHGCKKFVFSSSATVYSTRSEPPFAEDAPLSASSPYGRTKLFGEEIVRDLAASDAQWRAILLRYFNPVGAHPSGRIGESPQGIPNNLFPYVTQTAVGALSKLNVFGGDYPTHDGTCVRDYIHICDLASGHVAALRALARVQGVEAINLGTGRGNTVLEVTNAFERALGKSISQRIVNRRPGDIAVSVADPAKAASFLRWKARHRLDDMCADARWQQQNPRGYASP